jgi:hypothetical protein
MKKLMLALGVCMAFVAVFVVRTTAKAHSGDVWYCSSNSNAVCYVKYVEFHASDSSSNDTYVHAQFTTQVGNCAAVRVTKGGGAGFYGATAETVKAAQASLLTALTTGLPIKFAAASGQNPADKICQADVIVVSKP